MNVPGTDTALHVECGISYREWLDLGSQLGAIARVSNWWIGDWMNAAVTVDCDVSLTEMYEAAVQETRLSLRTLRNLKSIASKVPEKRRRKELPISVHAAVASLSPAEQKKWLSLAVRNGWNRQQLRDEIRGWPSRPPVLATAVQTVCKNARPMDGGYLVRDEDITALAEVVHVRLAARVVDIKPRALWPIRKKQAAR